jgi:putative SOS response-associated peptidase YedK
MCYSAMVEEDIHKLMKQFPGQLDYVALRKLLTRRLDDPSIKVPKGFEANFDHPKTAADDEIKSLIDRHRTALASKLEKEVFTQKKRLADAERKLKEKETKGALNDQRVATNKIEASLAKLSDLRRTEVKSRDSRIFPFVYAPILLKRDGKTTIELARYHLRQPRQPESVDRKYPGLYNARRDNLEKFWREEFGQSHALMVVSSFYENVDRDGKNAVLHFVPKPAEPMLVACLYGIWNEGQDDELISFAAITDEPPQEVAAAGHDRCIVNLKPENVERWLTPEGRSKQELQAILDDKQRPYYEHELLAA